MLSALEVFGQGSGWATLNLSTFEPFFATIDNGHNCTFHFFIVQFSSQQMSALPRMEPFWVPLCRLCQRCRTAFRRRERRGCSGSLITLYVLKAGKHCAMATASHLLSFWQPTACYHYPSAYPPIPDGDPFHDCQHNLRHANVFFGSHTV